MGPSPNALKYQVIGTLHAAAYMRGAGLCCCCLLLPLLSLPLRCVMRLPLRLCRQLLGCPVGCRTPGRLPWAGRAFINPKQALCCPTAAALCPSIHLPAVPLIVINTIVILLKLLIG